MIQLRYRIDGGPESYYTDNKTDAIENYNCVIDEFGEAVIWEITEEWEENDEDWEMIDENIIRSNRHD
jgi:hypothetical protein